MFGKLTVNIFAYLSLISCCIYYCFCHFISSLSHTKNIRFDYTMTEF